MKACWVMLALAGTCVWSAASRAQDLPVTDGLLLWLDATDASTLFQDEDRTTPATDGDPIGGWADKSGNGFHAYQDDSVLAPTLTSTAINGLPTVRLDGTDGDGMYIDEGLVLDRPYTAFIVNQYWGDTRGRTLQGRDANWLLGLWSAHYGAFAEGWIGNYFAGARPADWDWARWGSIRWR
jgi:hypothetical protein